MLTCLLCKYQDINYYFHCNKVPVMYCYYHFDFIIYNYTVEPAAKTTCLEQKSSVPFQYIYIYFTCLQRSAAYSDYDLSAPIVDLQ